VIIKIKERIWELNNHKIHLDQDRDLHHSAATTTCATMMQILTTREDLGLRTL